MFEKITKTNKWSLGNVPAGEYNENIVIYLKASVASQQKRTSHDKSRPLLQTPNRHAKLSTLATQRNPLYEKFADIIIDTDRQNIGKSIQQIISQLSKPNC